MSKINPKITSVNDASWHLSRDAVAHLGAQQLTSLIMEEMVKSESLREKLLQALKSSRPHGLDGLMPTGGDGDELHIVGDSPPMRQVFNSIRKFGATDLPILITGESGTGKELAAAAIHERSTFSNGPFVPVNCGGIPESLISSELFGYEKGAFTGANQRKIGRIESAEGGTLFLDEIGDLPLELQGNLLRFLQEKTIDPVGSRKSVPINVRVVAATNRNLRDAVQRGRFRLDLYYRLNVLSIHMPPLRDREGDIELLTQYIVKRLGRELQCPVLRVDPDALAALKMHPWLGNVRELTSVLRRAVVMADSDALTRSDLILDTDFEAPAPERHSPEPEVDNVVAAPMPTERRGLAEMRDVTEKEILSQALLQNRHNITKTAEELGISRVTLYRHMEKYGLQSKRNSKASTDQEVSEMTRAKKVV